MAEYINRSKLIMHLFDWALTEAPLKENHEQKIKYDTIQTCIEAIERMESADVVESKSGKWMVNEEYVATSKTRKRKTHVTTWMCSKCMRSNGRHRTNFCPNCGADNRGEEDGRTVSF